MFLFGIGLFALLAYRNYYSPPRIKLVNQSGMELESVALDAGPGPEAVPNISIGKTRTVLVHPKGEGGLKLSFTSSGQKFEKNGLAYVESLGGYRVTLVIDEKFNVTVR